jgi:hypothetical protein
MTRSFDDLSLLVARVVLFTVITAVIGTINGRCQTPVPVPAPHGETIWKISSPDVTKPRVQFPTVRFAKGDKVIVTGGGCVQTGGHGLTWKRYINPFGNNSDRLYHGRIWIPGATDGMVRISSIVETPAGGSASEGQPLPASVGLPLIVGQTPPHASIDGEQNPYFLWLGYEDDQYHDNGYYKHDEGNDHQCRLIPQVAAEDDNQNDGNAWLQIRIVHPNAVAYKSIQISDPRAPFDLWWNQVDENLLPFNPDWWVHHRSLTDREPVIANSNSGGCDTFRESKYDHLILGKDSRCTMWDPDIDEANLGSLFCHAERPFADSVHGHVNWGIVTYRGLIHFDVANTGHGTGNPPGDGDYDWWLSPIDDSGRQIDNGIAAANVAESGGKRAIALEFSSRETVDKIKDNEAWWDRFHRKVDEGAETAEGFLNSQPDNPSEAIVIGLIGFDNEHGNRPEGARVELHPVYGFAIRVSSSDAEDVWAILARNWGNEGSCSNGWDATRSKWQHYLALPGNRMSFFFPGTKGASAQITSRFKTNYDDAKDKFQTNAMADGVLLTIVLPDPKDKKLFWGEVYIRKS